MDDMQRYRDIKANADPEDPAKQLLASIAVSYDQALAEAIRLERRGEYGVLHRVLCRMGLTETATELLLQPISAPPPQASWPAADETTTALSGANRKDNDHEPPHRHGAGNAAVSAGRSSTHQRRVREGPADRP